MRTKKHTDTQAVLAVLMRLAGIPLILWAPNEAAFWVGIGLVLGKDISNLVTELRPK